MTKLKLLDILERLTPTQFKKLIEVSGVDKSLLPSSDTPQTEQAIAFLELAKALGGIGIIRVAELLLEMKVIKPEIVVVTILEYYYQQIEHYFQSACQHIISEVKAIRRNFILPDVCCDNLEELVKHIAEIDQNYLAKLIIFLIKDIKIDNSPSSSPTEKKDILEKLENWGKKIYGNTWQELQQQQDIKGNEELVSNPSAKACLLICIEKGSNSFMAKSWLLKDLNQYNREQDKIQICCPLDNSGYKKILGKRKISQKSFLEYLQEIVSTAWKQHKSRVMQIQVFLPLDVIATEDTILEFFEINSSFTEDSRPIGVEYELTLRLTERFKSLDDPLTQLWRDKCELLKSRETKTVLENLPEHSTDNLKQLYLKLRSPEVIGVRFETLKAKQRKTVMGVLLDAGIPVALYVRETKPDDSSENIKSLCQKWNLNKLIENLKDQRSDAWALDKTDHIANHVSLLWDRYDLLPPQHLLDMP